MYVMSVAIMDVECRGEGGARREEGEEVHGCVRVWFELGGGWGVSGRTGSVVGGGVM